MSPEEVADRVRNVRFTSVTFRPSYDPETVDDLLDALVAAALTGVTLATVVAGFRLTPVRFRPGYAVDEVDAFLTAIIGGTRPRP